VPANILDASFTVTSRVKRRTPLPHEYKQLLEPSNAIDDKTPSSTLEFAIISISSVVSSAHVEEACAATVPS
jgi:hypothetical protein